MRDFVTISNFTYPHEFAVLKLVLENKGIRFFFQNETMVGVVPFYSIALGGILLKVHRDDVIAAQEILKKFV